MAINTNTTIGVSPEFAQQALAPTVPVTNPPGITGINAVYATQELAPTNLTSTPATVTQASTSAALGINQVYATQALAPGAGTYGTGDSTGLGISPVYAQQALAPGTADAGAYGTGDSTGLGISPVYAPQALAPSVETGGTYGTGDSTGLGISPVYSTQALAPGVDYPATTPGTTKDEVASLTTGQVPEVNKDTLSATGQTAAVRSPKSVNDWRVKLSLAPNTEYLYNQTDSGILAPLKNTGGVIFPYTPQISMSYSASYDQTDLTHSNYRIYQYRGSNVGEISISGEFTAQDTVEANYLLAVIHFFKSATKMFYGKDKEPKPGTPPPLCYLSGYGLYQFNNCPLVISNFSYTLPNDVDYIRAGSSKMTTGENFSSTAKNNQPAKQTTNSFWSKLVRMSNSGVKPGAMRAPPEFSNNNVSANENTYVPTKMTIQITCLPIVTRKDISDNFSLREYSKGNLWGIW